MSSSTDLSHHEAHGTRPISVTVATARKLIGVGNTKFYELIKNGDLETVRIGRRVLVTYRSLERLIDRLLLHDTAPAGAPRRRGRPPKRKNSVGEAAANDSSHSKESNA